MTRIIILEGPDGAGKTTLARHFRRQLPNAIFQHHTRQPGLNKSCGRFYVESMMPALLGLADIIMDRCWLSESPYAHAFWEGKDRLPVSQIRVLERIAMRCQTSVVLCDPGLDAVLESFRARKGLEMLDNEAQLTAVYNDYKGVTTALPSITYNYKQHAEPHFMTLPCTTPHDLGTMTAGALSAKVIVVTPPPPELTDQDSIYQYPMTAFGNAGESRWVTNQFEQAGYSEAELFWVPCTGVYNVSDMVLMRATKTFALGVEAASAARSAGMPSISELEHPTTWRRDSKSTPPYIRS